jgi:protein-S-isoprenylcysteine O-methyltransferase Ste14
LRYLFLALAWTAYCTLHSAMISETATRFLKRRLRESFRFYRLFFNSTAMLTLIPVLWYSNSLRQEAIFRWEGAWLILRFLLVGCGILLVVAGARHYRLRQFIGISQLREASSGGWAAGGGIDSSGVLGLVRHPWYTAVVLLLWAHDLDAAALVGNGVLTVYIVIGTRLEERKLVREFGDAYRSYQGRVSMFIPLKWTGLRIAP